MIRNPNPNATRIRVLGTILCLGIFSTLAQVMLTREMLVAFFGNEVTIGVVLSSWLLSISIGAYSAKWLVDKFKPGFLTFLLHLLLLLPVFLFPFQIIAIRYVRLLLRVPFGEFAPLGSIATGAFLVCLPSCFCIGFFFPVACRLLEKADSGSPKNDQTGVSAVYMLEALGSMLAGIALTFLLLPYYNSVRILLLTVAVVLAGSSYAAHTRRISLATIIISVTVFLAALTSPPFVEHFQKNMTQIRWKGFGILQEQVDSTIRPETKLCHSIDTKYQNLAVTELEGQYALYGNGELMFVFPDPYGDEHEIHFIMAQKPEAKRILMIGGNPVGFLPELLKYEPDNIVYVEIDSGVGEILSRVEPEKLKKLLSDPRVTPIIGDAPRYLQNCKDNFDIVFIYAPDPTTIAANRFYTYEFFQSVKSVLTDGGFMFTSITVSERLQTDAATLGATVYQALAAVFSSVLVTAEADTRILAGSENAKLTFDRQTLYKKSKNAEIETLYFRPEYFLGADELTPSKTAIARERFSEKYLSLNTTLKPTAFFHNLVMWSHFSGSNVASLFLAIEKTDYRMLAAGIGGVGILFFLIGIALKFRHTDRSRHASTLWTKLMICIVIGTTGFCGMAFEMLLIFLFQGIHGYIYARIGLVVALFMLGLVSGVFSGKQFASFGTGKVCVAMGVIEVLLMLFALLIPSFVAFVPGEVLIYLAVVFAGWCVGTEFPLANHLLRSVGAGAGTAAAVTDASDHAGAAMGAVIAGVFLVPVFGIGASGIVLASLKGASLLCLLSLFEKAKHL